MQTAYNVHKLLAAAQELIRTSVELVSTSKELIIESEELISRVRANIASVERSRQSTTSLTFNAHSLRSVARTRARGKAR